MDIFEGTEQIQQGIVARAISEGRIDPLRQDRWRMELELTDDAAALLAKRGRTLVIDLIRPTGWGKVAEVAVATQTKGRNLAPYVRLGRDDLEVLVAEGLVPLAPTVRISTRRWVTKGFQVDFPGAPGCQL